MLKNIKVRESAREKLLEAIRLMFKASTELGGNKELLQLASDVELVADNLSNRHVTILPEAKHYPVVLGGKVVWIVKTTAPAETVKRVVGSPVVIVAEFAPSRIELELNKLGFDADIYEAEVAVSLD